MKNGLADMLAQIDDLNGQLAQKTEYLKRANQSRRKFQERAHRAEGILASHKGENDPVALRDAISSLRTNLHHRDNTIRKLRLQLIGLTTPSGNGLPERWLVINEESFAVAERYKVFDDMDAALQCMIVHGVPERWVEGVRTLTRDRDMLGYVMRFAEALPHIQLIRVR